MVIIEANTVQLEKYRVLKERLLRFSIGSELKNHNEENSELDERARRQDS